MFSSNGYQKFSNGLIIQWGKSPLITANATATITFPVEFSVIPFNVVATAATARNGRGDKADGWVITNINSSNFTLINGFEIVAEEYYWIAIGY